MRPKPPIGNCHMCGNCAHLWHPGDAWTCPHCTQVYTPHHPDGVFPHGTAAGAALWLLVLHTYLRLERDSAVLARETPFQGDRFQSWAKARDLLWLRLHPRDRTWLCNRKGPLPLEVA